MDAQQFLAEFGHIANAPSGVARLRELILSMASQGRLVAQEHTDEPATVLLTRIQSEKKLLVAAKKIKRASPFRLIADVEKRITLPLTWEWARLGEIAFKLTDGSHNPPKGHSSGYPMLSGQNVLDGTIDFSNPSRLLSEDDFNRENSRTEGKAGDILLTIVGTIGRSAVIPEGAPPFALQRSVAVIRTPLLPEYLSIQLRSPVARSYYDTHGKGTAQKGIYLAKLGEMPIPVPPLQEQSRIVAKVDELMTLCDKLEAQQQARRTLQNALRQSTLQAVASATSPHELQTTWSRLADNFGRLFHAPEDVSEIKALILDLAIQGLLADRQLDDEPAETLISRSLESKRVRLASGEMKNKKPSATDIVDVEINIPAHWKRASLDELFQFIDYRGKTPAKTNSGVVLVTAKNVRPGFIANEPVEFLSESSYQAWMTRGFPRIGDLLITTEAPLGNVARIEEQPSFALAQRVIDLQPFSDLNTKCAMYFMMSPLFQSLLEENSTGMTAKGIKAGKLKQLLLPIPPKEEQQRIVQRVEELMNVCSVLSSQLESARKQAARLAVASISSLTGIIAVEQEEEPMKAPQTELIARLRLGTAPDIKAQSPLATILARHHGEMSAKDLWQRFGGEIDAFYAQLKTEVTHGWILEPAPAEMREKQADVVSA